MCITTTCESANSLSFELGRNCISCFKRPACGGGGEGLFTETWPNLISLAYPLISKGKFFSWRWRRWRRRSSLISRFSDHEIHENSFKSETSSVENRLEIFWRDLHVCATICSCTEREAFLIAFPFPGSSMSLHSSSFLHFRFLPWIFTVGFNISFSTNNTA